MELSGTGIYRRIINVNLLFAALLIYTLKNKSKILHTHLKFLFTGKIRKIKNRASGFYFLEKLFCKQFVIFPE